MEINRETDNVDFLKFRDQLASSHMQNACFFSFSFFSAIIKIFEKKYAEWLTFRTKFPLSDDQEHYKNLSKIKLLHFAFLFFYFLFLFWQTRISRPLRVSDYSLEGMQSSHLTHTLGYY